MFGLIFGIIIFIAAIILGVALINEDYKGAGIGGMIGGIVLAIVFIVCSCITSVPTGNTGIVTTFGKVEDYVLDSGLSMKAPWQKVIKMDNRIQKENVTLACFSSDIQEVSVSYTVNYQIDKANAMNIYKSIGTSYFATVIQPSITEAVKEVTALYTAEALVGNREELSNAIEEVLAARLLPYNINVIDTSIEDMDFTDAFTNAVEAKQVAEQNKLKAQTEAEQRIIEANAAAEIAKVNAEAAAEAKKIAADAEAYEIAAKAEAEAAANKQIAESLTKELIEYKYYETWNGELPGVVGADTIIKMPD